MAAHVVEKPEPIDKRRASVPPALSELVMQALEKEADKRPQSAEEMLNILEAIQTSSSTSAASAPRVGSPPKRSVAIVASIALLLAVIATGAILFRHNSSPREIQPRLAVLPFENGGNGEDAYFVDGMTEAITNRLASISGMTVLGRLSAKRYAGSAMSPQQIGHEMGVNYLLTGSVRWDKSQPGKSVVSIRPALVRVADGAQIWSDPYDAVLANEFKLQSDVAERVANALDVALLPHETRELARAPTSDPQAYDDYLRGRFLWNKRTASGLREAATYFNRAIARDPEFGRAYAGLADVYVALPLYAAANSEESHELARLNAEKAIALDSTLGSPHAALAYLLASNNNWVGAENEFKRAIEIEPRYATAYQWYSRLLLTLGRFDEARRTAAQARSLEPLSSIINASLGIVELCSHDYPHATSTLSLAVSIDPTNPVSRLAKAQGLIHTGNYSNAIAEIDTALRYNDSPDSVAYESVRAYALARNGDTTAARQMLKRFKGSANPDQLAVALVHAGLHEDDSSAVWLAKFIGPGGGDKVELRWPLFDRIRNDSRVQAVLRSVFAHH
jgi:TolB-like protein/Flp pilus assembly protein TadD